MPCGTLRDGTTATGVSESSAACSAASTMFLLLGSTMVNAAFVFCTAAMMSAALGFIV